MNNNIASKSEYYSTKPIQSSSIWKSFSLFFFYWLQLVFGFDFDFCFLFSFFYLWDVNDWTKQLVLNKHWSRSLLNSKFKSLSVAGAIHFFSDNMLLLISSFNKITFTLAFFVCKHKWIKFTKVGTERCMNHQLMSTWSLPAEIG